MRLAPRTLCSVIWIVQLCSGIRVSDNEEPDEHSPEEAATSSSTTKYRLSLARPEKPTNRVPAHLQGVRSTGYVYDDADDVIHIIEPPQHFQQLKRLINQKGEAAVWEQQRKLRISRPQATAAVAAAAAAVDSERERTKVKEQPRAEKVEMPQRQRNGKPVAAVGTSGDLQTQETKALSDHYSQQLGAFGAHFPMEILTSVRKTERLLQRKRPNVAHAKQRVKAAKTHTVIMEKGYERERYKWNKERRLGGKKFAGKVRRTRERREVDADIETVPNRRTSKRHKRSILQRTSTKAQQLANADLQKGTKLLLHITELLKNATYYLPDDVEEKATDAATPSPAVLRELQKRLQHDAQPKPLIGEIEPTGISSRYGTNRLLDEQDLYDILENSLNATGAFMNVLSGKRNLTPAVSGCVSSSDANAGNRLQSLQSKINCMRKEIISTSAVTSGNRARGKRRYGERLREKSINTILPTEPTRHVKKRIALRVSNANNNNNNKLNISNNINHNSFRDPKTLFNISKGAASNENPLESQNISATLLYDDVMMNIRNMLQAKNLQLLEEHQRGAAEIREANEDASLSDTAPPRFIPPSEAEDLAEFRDLNKYLSELQQIVQRLPATGGTISPTANTTERRNFHAEVSGASSTNQRDWYLINGEGKIYQTPIQEQLKPTAAIFHRFPDIPNADDFLRNYTLPADAANLYEIL